MALSQYFYMSTNLEPYYKLEQCRHALSCVCEVMTTDGHLPKAFSVSPPDAINITKLGENAGAIITDSCHSCYNARKEQRGIAEKAGGETHPVDCLNHLRCVVIKNQLIRLDEFTTALLKESLDKISPILRVSTSLESVLIVFDKEFSLCANYPKGHGELFLTWLQQNYPDALLFHVECASGGRQDLTLMASLPIF